LLPLRGTQQPPTQASRGQLVNDISQLLVPAILAVERLGIYDVQIAIKVVAIQSIRTIVDVWVMWTVTDWLRSSRATEVMGLKAAEGAMKATVTSVQAAHGEAASTEVAAMRAATPHKTTASAVEAATSHNGCASSAAVASASASTSPSFSRRHGADDCEGHGARHEGRFD
jgi:hypothetical protein